jgi:hypothetical protein
MSLSTRFNIVARSIEDTKHRLADLPPGPTVRVFQSRLDGYERAFRAFERSSPTEEQRTLLVKMVLDLNMDVIRYARSTGG